MKGKQSTVPWHSIVCTAKVLVNFMTLFAANLQPHVTGLPTKWIHTCCYCSQSRNLRTTMETCDFGSWHPTLPVKFSLLHSISISRDTGGINTVGSLSGPHSRAVNLFDIGTITSFNIYITPWIVIISELHSASQIQYLLCWHVILI